MRGVQDSRQELTDCSLKFLFWVDNENMLHNVYHMFYNVYHGGCGLWFLTQERELFPEGGKARITRKKTEKHFAGNSWRKRRITRKERKTFWGNFTANVSLISWRKRTLRNPPFSFGTLFQSQKNMIARIIVLKGGLNKREKSSNICVDFDDFDKVRWLWLL